MEIYLSVSLYTSFSTLNHKGPKEETTTVIPHNVENPEDAQDEEENTQEQDKVRSHHLSPQISLALSKTTKLKGRSYQARKMRINNLLDVIEADYPSTDQPRSLHHQQQALLLLFLKL